MDKVKEFKKPMAGPEGNQDRKPRPKGRGRRPQGSKPEIAEDFQQRLVDLARVTRVMAGGKRMKFRACLVIGDGKGRVGAAVAKGADVSDAIAKAVIKAKKHMIKVPIIDGTIPHDIYIKFKAAKLLIKPARKGSGIKAGGVVRIILDLAGVKDAVGKILGGSNKLNNVEATLEALRSFKTSAIRKLEKKSAEQVDKIQPVAKEERKS